MPLTLPLLMSLASPDELSELWPPAQRGSRHGLTAAGSAHTGAVSHSGDVSAARGILSPAQTPPPRGGEAKAESQAWSLSPEHAAGLSPEPRSRGPRKLCALMCPAGRLMRLHILDLPRAGGDGLRGGTGVRQGQGQLCFLQTSFPVIAWEELKTKVECIQAPETLSCCIPWTEPF